MNRTSLGKRVQTALRESIEALRPLPDVLDDAQAGRSYQLLALRYVEGKDVRSILQQLAIGHSQYYRDHQRAVAAVAELLWERSTTGSDDFVMDTPPKGSRREASRHNLPIALTRFIGRRTESEQVRQLLIAARLVTLTGTGGCGKTRLAIEVGGSVLDQFSDGVWLVDLAPIGDPDLVLPVVVSTLGLEESAGGLGVGKRATRDLTDVLVAYLYDRRLLLILDNCEHVIDVAARLAETLLRACPDLQIVATSLEHLQVPGEASFQVPPLTLPDPGGPSSFAELANAEAIQLFVDRARLAEPTFRLNPANAAAVALICTELDGIPLAIELAAARIRSLAPDHIATRLADRFSSLAVGSRTAHARQRTLRATIEWSYDLLDEAERRLLGRLAVFAGGWSLDSAEAICAGEGDVLDLLTRLVDKSVVLVEKTDRERRYRLIEMMRQFGWERLAASGEATRLRDRHRNWFLDLAERAEPQLVGPRQVEWLDRLEIEHHNLRAALAWSAAHGPAELGVRFVAALGLFWAFRDHRAEGLEWQGRLLVATGAEAPTPARARALNSVWLVAPDLPARRRAAEESLAICRKAGDRRGAALAAVILGESLLEEGALAGAESSIVEGLAIAREVGDSWTYAQGLFSLGQIALARHDLDGAHRHLGEHLVRLRDLADLRGIAFALTWLGRVAFERGEYAQARAYFQEGLAINRRIRSRRRTAQTLLAWADLARAEGKLDEARALARESQGLAWEIGSRRVTDRPLLGLSLLATSEYDYRPGIPLCDDARATFAGDDVQQVHG
jgi:predicted ATPase